MSLDLTNHLTAEFTNQFGLSGKYCLKENDFGHIKRNCCIDFQKNPPCQVETILQTYFCNQHKKKHLCGSYCHVKVGKMTE